MPESLSSQVNDTSTYHLTEMETLGWELTVCNALEPHSSPIREILVHDDTYGNLLCAYLEKYVPMKKLSSVVEIGGGYGYLMRDLLSRYPSVKAQMVDISPYLVDRQKETLAGTGASFLCRDLFSLPPGFFSDFDLAVLNENVGDFPTLCGVTMDMLKQGKDNDYFLQAARMIEQYGLAMDVSPFNFNVGALMGLEKLCRDGVPYIYISEHSCEASVSQEFKGIIPVEPAGDPERIALKGHDEYTIAFSNLERAGKSLGYRAIRGNYTDIIDFKRDGRVNFILNSQTEKDEHEIIRLFIEDLFKYEYLLLMKD